MSTSELTNIIEKSISDIKGEETKSFDVRGKSAITDYFIICSGTSTRHVCAIADRVKDDLEKEGFDVRAIEGKETGEWVLLDAGDAIVHVFTKEARENYQLEKLYSVL